MWTYNFRSTLPVLYDYYVFGYFYLVVMFSCRFCWSLFTVIHMLMLFLYLEREAMIYFVAFVEPSCNGSVYMPLLRIIKLLMYESMLFRILITREDIKILNEKVTGSLWWIMGANTGKHKNNIGSEGKILWRRWCHACSELTKTIPQQQKSLI